MVSPIIISSCMATFHIETDRSTYYPGDNITGRVFVLIPATISNTQGITLKFTGLESVKWQQHFQTKSQNFTNPSQQYLQTNKIANAGQGQAYHVHQTDELSVSECHSQENKKQDLKPRFIKTAQNKYFEVKYFQRHVDISKAVVQLMPAGKLQAGQYSFPFSFNTSPKWPPSFKQQSSHKKATVFYSLTATIEPFSPRFQFKQRKEILLCDRTSSKNVTQFQNPVSSFYCLKKGTTQLRVSLDRQGYRPGENGEIIIQVDNSHCQADIQSLTATLNHSQLLRIGESAARTTQIFKKQVNCVTKAGQLSQGQNSIRVPFTLPKTPSTTQAQLITSTYTLQIRLKHDALLHKNEGYSISFTVYPQDIKSQLPWEMRTKWQPKTMETVKLAPSNVEGVLKQANGPK